MSAGASAPSVEVAEEEGGGAAAPAPGGDSDEEASPKKTRRQSFRKGDQQRASVYEDDIQHCGYLQKQTQGAIKRFQKRYFEVSGHYLRYYESEKKKELKGALEIFQKDQVEDSVATKAMNVMGLYLKANLEFVRANYRKSMKLPFARSAPRDPCGISDMPSASKYSVGSVMPRAASATSVASPAPTPVCSISPISELAIRLPVDALTSAPRSSCRPPPGSWSHAT